jgi:F-type H+-transporting ATPase subunit gamma
LEVDGSSHPLLKKPKILTGKRLALLITTNKGLCGGLNSSLFRHVHVHYPNIKHNEWVTAGLKGAGFVTTMEGKIIADFSSGAGFVSSVPAITAFIIEQFLNGTVDGVDIIYNEFQSILKQNPRIKSILPLTIESVGEIQSDVNEDQEFLIEPNPEEVFESLLPSYVENQIRDAVLQAEASEHAARMVAMRNATDNAKSFISELTLVYNKARQEKITNEIADLVTARAAIVSE